MTDPKNDGLNEGRRRRDKALRKHEAKHGPELLVIQNRFARALRAFALVSVSDLGLTDDLRGKHVGAAHSPFKRWITEAGMVTSTVPRNKARRVIQWQLSGPDSLDEIEKWLAANPLGESDAATRDVWLDGLREKTYPKDETPRPRAPSDAEVDAARQWLTDHSSPPDDDEVEG